MEIHSNILQFLLFISTFISLVESETNFSHLYANDSIRVFEDVEYNENISSMIISAKSRTSIRTCALLMYGNALIVSINLCGNKTYNCPYFSNGQSFTAWIDVTLKKTLQVWLVSGSYLEAQRPLKPLIEYPNFTLPIKTEKNVSLFFRGSSCNNQIKVNKTWSWSLNIPSATQEAIPFSKNDTNWNKVTIGAQGISGLLTTFFIIGLLSIWLEKHHSRKSVRDCLGRRVFKFKELCSATKNFSKSTKLGRGGFGTVYKGSLERFDNTLVAIKRIHYDSRLAQKTFRTEISCLTKIQHKNVVQLLGWCHEKGRLLLVYEYMSNGSLYEWLHDKCKCKGVLPWKMRLSILESIALAVEYLHTKCTQCILHRNIKSNNIMLDTNFEAHLGDFGLAHLLDDQNEYHTTIGAGYLEYMAPEMPYTGQATKESDVYSYGILVLEVLCGKHPLDNKAIEAEDLVLLFKCCQAHKNGCLLNIADPKLFQNFQPSQLQPLIDESIERSENKLPLSYSYDLENDNVFGDFQINTSDYEVIKNEVIEDEIVEDDVETQKIIIENFLQLGLLCCVVNPKDRPTMEQVVQVLKQIHYIDNVDIIIKNVSMPSMPKTKPFGLYFKFLQSRKYN